MAAPEFMVGNGTWHTLADFAVPSKPGNERQAMERVAEAVQKICLSHRRLERLKTAVAEATMNSIEHGNGYRAEFPVAIQVLASKTDLLVRVTDRGGGQQIPDPETPNLEAKLASQQTTRGWGLFLIDNMVDAMDIITDNSRRTIQLVMHLEGNCCASKAR
jgi:anti-sigma regulatory factor (Ser/Thr protein kinase)